MTDIEYQQLLAEFGILPRDEICTISGSELRKLVSKAYDQGKEDERDYAWRHSNWD